MAMRNPDETKRARVVAIGWTLLAYTGAFLIGIIGFRMMQSGLMGDGAAVIAADSEKVMPIMVMTLLNPLLAGILLSGAVSAMMSTASSQLIVVSSSITEDLWSNISKRVIPEKRMLFLNKSLTLTVGIVAFVLVLTMEDTVYGLVSYAWSGIGASFGPAVVLLLSGRNSPVPGYMLHSSRERSLQLSGKPGLPTPQASRSVWQVIFWRSWQQCC